MFILSTSFNPEVVKSLHEQGANYYIRKPADFADLKKIISTSLDLLTLGNLKPPPEDFVLHGK